MSNRNRNFLVIFHVKFSLIIKFLEKFTLVI